jgi:hypothetical protein
MLDKNLPRPFYVGVNLRQNEYQRIIATAEKFGVSKAETLRRECKADRNFFAETVEHRGRIEGVSPWKRSA